MNILVADKLDDTGIDALEKLGCKVALEPQLTADDLPGKIAGFDILVVRSTKVTEATLRANRRLKLVIRAGAGFDTIDVRSASNDGIYVANCPGKNAIAVAELTMALILCCDRQVPEQTRLLLDGTWDKKRFSKARGLFGCTLGLLGLGSIGVEVARRARAFGLDVVAWSRNITPQRATAAGVRAASSIEQVAREADILSLHLAANAETSGIIDDKMIAAMKPGAYLINTSRGSLIDEAALARGVKEKGIRLGVDVYCSEPGAGQAEFTWPLANSAGFAGSHHIGASTTQSQRAIADEVVAIVEQFQKDGVVLNCVNRAVQRDPACLLRVRHRNKPGVLAHVFRELSEAGINVEEMENVLYEGLEAACARIQLSKKPGAATLEKLNTASEHILELEIGALPPEEVA